MSSNVTAGIPGIENAPVLFCFQCDEAMTIIHWVDDHGDPVHEAVEEINYCPFCGKARKNAGVTAENGDAGESKPHLGVIIEEWVPGKGIQVRKGNVDD